MIEHGEAPYRQPPRRPPYPGFPPRRRKRWVLVAGLAVGWLIMLYLTGSLVGGTALLVLFAVIGAGAVLSLRSAGIRAGHPWVRQLAARPWRDGQDVLQLSLRHLPDVFVVTPAGALLAPNAVDVHLNPADLRTLSEVMDVGLAGANATEVYLDQVAAHGARFTGPEPAEVRITGDPAVPPGRYLLRQGKPRPAGGPDPRGAVPGGRAGPAAAGYRRPVAVPAQEPAHALADRGPAMAYHPAGGRQQGPPGLAEGSFVHAHDGCTSTGDVLSPPSQWLPTVAELQRPMVPLLSLVTGESVVQTAATTALAGRGAVDLPLPQEPTISREHARFSYSGGQWWVTNLGRNGLTLNGQRVVSEQPVQHGDLIRWGTRPDAPVSRVEVGAG